MEAALHALSSARVAYVLAASGAIRPPLIDAGIQINTF